MLKPLPPGFPTPDPKDPEPLGRELGRASAMWMRGAYGDAAKKVEEVARLFSSEHARDSARVDAARVATLLRVSASLTALVEEMNKLGITDPSSMPSPFSLEIDSEDLTESERTTAQSMAIASIDIQSVHRESEIARDLPAKNAPVRTAPPPPPKTPPRVGSTTLEQAKRPSLTDASPPADGKADAKVETKASIGSERTLDLKRTLPQGIRDPRVPKPTPRPFPRVSPVEIRTAETSAASPGSAPTVSDPFADLDVPDHAPQESVPTTKKIAEDANYPPSEAMPSAPATRRVPQPGEKE